MNKIKTLFNKMSLGMKASFVYTFASLITKGLGIISLPIFTNLLTTEEVGVSNLFSTWSSILGIVATISLVSSAYNIGLKDYENDRYSFTMSMLSLSNLATIITFLIYIFLHNFLYPYIGISLPLMITMFISFIFHPAFDFWLAKQRYEMKYKSTAIITIIASALSVGISIFGVLFFKDSQFNLGEVKVFASTITMIVVSFVFYIFFIVKSKAKVKIFYWKYILPISLPLIIHSLSKHILDASDKIMISNMLGDDAVGIYSTLYSISSLVLIFWAAINGSLIPYMYDKLSKNKTEDMKKVIIPVLLLFSLVAICLTLVAPEIVMILTNEEYYSAVHIIPPIAAGIYLTALYNIFGNVISFKRKTIFIALGTVIAAVANIILNYIFIPIFGNVAAAYTTLVGYIVLSILQYIFMKIVYKKDILNPLVMILISGITIVFCLLINFTYEFAVLRYLIIIVIIVLFIIFNKKIREKIKLFWGRK